ncbi:conserved hypothetical protein [Leishmania mexicana MHOM/GT/2001/U1103]|uniref:Present in the outer mitochondrial membrane proteome 22 n=1 Tax=Leishmania mexicana (strain MHOM/GT/2001/U1103) TaxID=929439 RepID=E9B4D3_LEIMU|nr:conserved hypothetical protein [Leishmania mexicana MHOM/GT/2001/U1103]CBZ30101.1 conserved hypothetical protein [Leishmania mexicana MHOM/GT/2001/U1103]
MLPTPVQAKHDVNAATPQATLVTAGAPASVASNPSPRPSANGRHAATQSVHTRPTNGTALPAIAPSTQRATSQPAGFVAKAAPPIPKADPSFVPKKPISSFSPGTLARRQVPGSGYGIGSAMGSFGGGAMVPTGVGGAPNPAYGALFMQPLGGSSMYGGGSMFDGLPPGAADGFMYGGQNPTMMYSSGYGTSTMDPLGGPMGSMYGMGSLMESMGGGSYGVSGYSAGGFGGSLYGGSLLGNTGSLYSTGGSLYGSSDPRAVIGSMYGSFMGSMLGGFGSIYHVDGPHTSLGVVRTQSIPGFSYTFGSNLGTTAYRPSFYVDAAASRSGSMRDNTFRISTSMKASEHEAGPKAKAEETARQHGSTGVDKDGRTMEEKPEGDTPGSAAVEAAKPESIMKKHTSATEAPKPLTTARQQGSGDAADQAAMLSSDFRIHNVAVLQQAGARSATVTKKDEACVMKGRSYAMDEVVEYKPASTNAAVESRHLNDLIEHVLAGHNSAILVADDGKAVGAAKAAVETTMTKLIEELRKPARNSYAGLSMTMCCLPSNKTVCDLLVHDAMATPLKTGNSPLFGPAVMGLKSEPIESGGHFAELYDTALRRGDQKSMVVCTVVVLQMRPPSCEGKGEVLLSSVFIGVSRTGPKAFHDIIDKLPASTHEIFSYAIDGPTVCVHVVSVSQDTTDAKVLEEAAKVGAVQNSPVRSGNVRRFIDLTESQLKSMLKRRDASTGSEKAELDNHVRRLSAVLKDAKSLLSNPQNTVPHVYQTEVGSSIETALGEPKTRAAPEAAAAGEVKDKLTAAADYKPRSTNIAALVFADVAEARAYSVKDTTVTASGRPFSVDEVVMRDAVKSTSTEIKTTGRVLSSFLKGYNGAVIVADSTAVASNGMESPTMSFLFTAVAGAFEKRGCKGVRVSIALLRESGLACDLSDTAAGLKPIEVSSSPLFGPILQNAALHRIRAQEDLRKLVDKAREQVKPLWNAQSAVHITVLHCFAEGDDVHVSSLLFSFSSSTCKLYEQLLRQQSHSMHDLFRYAFGGAATTVFIVSVGKEDQVTDVVASLGTQHSASVVRNRSPRQGSIRNFIAYTKASLDKRRERLATLSDDSTEKAAMIKVMAPMERMLSDHEKVMADPASNFPQAYLPENGGNKETNSEAPAAAGAARQEGDRCLTGNGNRDLARVQQPRQSPQMPAAGTTPRPQPEEPIAGFTEPRVVAFVGRDVAEDAKQLSLGSKDYTLDELVNRMRCSRGTTTGLSVKIAEIESRFAAVHNCSLISASSVTDALSTEEPVWMYFQKCLNNALATGKPGEEMCVDLSFAVVSADELLTDLLSDDTTAETKQLEIVSSPIYGPRIHNTRSVAVRSADEVAKLMETVHLRAESHLGAIRTGDLMVVGTALLRRRTNEGDVLVASLMGTLTGPSVKAYKEATEKAPVARRALLSSAYGGPSATVTLLNIGAEDESAQGMLSTAIAISKNQRNLVSRSGGVQAFVRFTEGTMKREQARAAAASGETKELHLQKMNRLQPVIEDHKKLLQDFTAPIPAYPLTRTSSSDTPKAEKKGAAVPGMSPASAAISSGSRKTPQSTKVPTPGSATKKEPVGPNRIQTVVVVTPNRKTPSSTTVVPVRRADETHITIQIADEQRTVECDEAVNRLDHSSAVRSDKLSAVAQHFVGGFNTAILCCDVGGSSAGPTACAKTVHHAIEAKPENSELYMSITAVKDDRNAKDLLAPSGSRCYTPLKVSNSLIFGPWVHGATMARLASVAQFDDAFSAAYAEAAKDGAVCVVSLVLKTIEKKDVIVNSLFMYLSTQLNAHAAAVNAPLKTDRRLYQYAVHGSCFSVGLLGLPDKVDKEGIAECLEVYARMRTIENRPMRSGSVRRFLAYSIKAAVDVKSRAERVTDELQRAMYKQRLASLEKMVDDARALIESPEGRIPNTYM